MKAVATQRPPFLDEYAGRKTGFGCASTRVYASGCATHENPVYAGACVTATDLPAIFGVPELRDHQDRCIRASTSDRDVLLVAPTGGGKSLAFWGAGLIRGGITLIVAPLRSLMADHWRRLEALSLPVRLWNSDVRDEYKAATVRLIDSGRWSGFLYTTPESLRARKLSSILTGRVDLAVIDEAHCCLRERGFRVNYAWLGSKLDAIGVSLRFACTATLPYQDRQALIDTLHLDNPVVVTAPIARSNLEISIVPRSPEMLTSILNQHHRQPGIIFAATIRTVENLYAQFTSQGRRVAIYHGELSVKRKQEEQAAFMSGERPVAVATDAFILGIDKSDIRFIVHYDYPKSIEDWVQGFGRAGRDDLPANVYGCFGAGSDEGFQTRRFLLRSTFPELDDLRVVWLYLNQAPYRDATAKWIGQTALGPNGQYSGPAILSALQRFGLAQADEHPEDKRRRLYRSRGDFDKTNWTPYLAERREAFSRLDQLADLVALPDEEIPGAIDAYFEGEDHG